METTLELDACFEEVILTEYEVQCRAGEIAADMNKHYGTKYPLTMVVVLKGGMLWATSLMLRLHMPVRVVVVNATSYKGTTQAQCRPQVHVPPKFSEQVGNGPVVVVDDILDHGHTLAAVGQMLYKHGGRDVRNCVMLRKRLPGVQQGPVQWVGFDVPNKFVIGYGLDYQELYRNLPYIAILKPEVYT